MANLSQNDLFERPSLNYLIEARDLFHYHLMNKKNVIATGIGRYLIRQPNDNDTHKIRSGNKGKRTLQNSKMTELSWPCIIVFVNNWEPEEDLANDGESDVVPKDAYMPDGKVIPICLVLSSEGEIQHLIQSETRLCPEFPLLIRIV